MVALRVVSADPGQHRFEVSLPQPVCGSTGSVDWRVAVEVALAPIEDRRWLIRQAVLLSGVGHGLSSTTVYATL
jgi:hypothetical protein